MKKCTGENCPMQIGMKLKNGLKPRGMASRERGSEWRECDGTINE